MLEVAGANQDEELSVVLGPEATAEDGGPPYVLLGGLVALVLLLGGIGLAVYAYYDRDPPLVDIRDYRRP